MPSNEFCYAAEQEAPDRRMSMRTNDNQVGAPPCRSIHDGFSYVAHLY
jgi:hypothetical protein